MKHILLVSVLLLCTSAGLALEEQETAVPIEAGDKFGELESIPEGIAVSHTPDPVRYTLYTPTISGVQWQHSTTVSSMGGPVTIVEFGYFVERNGQWELSYTYTSSDFAERYDSPKSELLPGKTYTDTRNQSAIDCVPEQMVKWYFIGLDAAGKRVKGEADLMLLTELDPTEHGPQY